ncbi:MAG: acyl carrier protein [Candidatus Omnitrophota bacterium]
MQQEEIENAVRDILAKNNHGIKMPRDFSAKESLFLRGIVDSFGVFPFVHALEVRFYIKIKKSDIHPGNLETIENLTAFISKKQKEGERQ